MVESKPFTLEAIQVQDFIDFQQDPTLMKGISGEKLLFADKIKKTNMYGWTQERTLVITNLAIYNFHKKEIKRMIPVKDIGGLTKTAPQVKSQEFTVHVPTSYDYRLLSPRRDQILDLLKRVFLIEHKKNCPLFIVKSKDLKDFTTTENDAKKQISRFPTPEYRTYDEDLLVMESPTLSKQSLSSASTVENTMSNLEDMQNIRSKQFNGSETESTYTDEERGPQDQDESEMKSQMVGGAQSLFSRSKTDAKLEDFLVQKLIGKGTFGKVFLVEHQTTGKLYAMKAIRKDAILENEQMDNIQLEKDILYTVNHPFLVNMEYVFQNEFRIYFLMQFVKGGELFRHLVSVKRFQEEQAKFFGAQVALALGHLHSKKILYRDLKPENVLVTEDGYLMVADFGLAKFISEGELANSFCGTAEYLAPEMLIGNGHDHTVDWWALGILIYEMIVGIPPFFHKNKHKMYHFIKESKIQFPDPEKHKIFVSEEAKDIIIRLLDKNKRTRLGVNGVDEILQHPWFKSIDIQQLLEKKLTPPYIPQLQDELAYFDQKLVNQNEVAESVLPAQARAMINQGQHNFAGFSS